MPAGDGKASGSSSGPASPGGLFAASGYQDDWLGSGADRTQQAATTAAYGGEATITPTAEAAADPFGAPDGGQGSISWLNQGDESQYARVAEQQYDAYGRPLGGAESELVGYDQRPTTSSSSKGTVTISNNSTATTSSSKGMTIRTSRVTSSSRVTTTSTAAAGL